MSEITELFSHPTDHEKETLRHENASLREEVERLRAENAQLKCNFAPILHFARQEQEKRGEPSVVIDSEGIPIENAVLRRNYITLRTRLEQAEAELAAEKGKVERVREWIVKSMICSAPYCKGCVDELEKILKK